MTAGDFFAEYGLFLAQLLTVLTLLAVLIGVVVVAARRGGPVSPQGLTVKKLNEKYEKTEAAVKRVVLNKDQLKKDTKARKKELKDKKSNERDAAQQRLFVVDFKGDIRASATVSLREEIDAVLAVASPTDSVLLRLENSGGMVHEHGLATSQLLRLKARGINLIVAVDRVAASGGYLMACVADHVMAAPFAIIGSIGVIVQLPNFHRYLEDKGVDFEQITAGRYKRTLTMFGENDDEGRQKLQDELQDVHELFKGEIAAHRPQIDLDEVATGEHWYGIRAKELNLIDELQTSDDYLLEAVGNDVDVFHVVFKRHQSLPERIMGSAEGLLYR